MPPKIELTSSSRPATIGIQATNERGETVDIKISGEHPLTLYLDKKELLTLMTLGSQPEALVLGWLRNQRLIKSADEIAQIQVDWETESAVVTSRMLKDHGRTLWEDAALQSKLEHKTTTTGCGQGTVYGDMMEALNDIRLSDAHPLSEEVLYHVMNQVRLHESIYKEAGAVHGCALCSNSGANRGEILHFVEDVGRHNAVDAIAGLMWLHQIQGENTLFYTTGRLTSEMVIKCAQMEIPILISRSGLTQMGYSIAQQLGITMLGRCQGKHYLLYTGQHRFKTSNQTLIA